MAQLAIKGHADRGDEVIKMLELLGGKSSNHNSGKCITLIYFINNEGYIETGDPRKTLDFTVLTLEEFLEKYPYKVGDKVTLDNKLCSIIWMCWECNNIYYHVQGVNDIFTKKVTADELKPYKDMSDLKDYGIATIKYIQENGSRDMELIIPYNQEIVNIDGRYILRDKKPQYPKTYEECCEVLMGKTNFQDFALIPTKFSTTQYKEIEISSEPPHINLINNFYKLLICRDAYWKVVGEQMGLDKSWKPDWESYKDNFCIITYKNKPIRYEIQYRNRILAFPTEEMRDAFYENFKDFIEECKELL